MLSESSSEYEYDSEYAILNDDITNLKIEDLNDVKNKEENENKDLIEIHKNDSNILNMSILDIVKKNLPILCPNLGNTCYINSTLQLIFYSYNLYYELT